MPYEGEPTIDWLLENAPIGPPARVADILARDIELLRPTHMSIYMGFAALPPDRVMASIEHFGTGVLPHVHDSTR